MALDADDVAKYGHDPRDKLEPDAYAADAAFAAAITPGSVGTLTNAGQLQAAIDAAGSKALVIYKFKRNDCVACAATVEDFAAAAKEYGDQGLFFEVPFEQSKPFCKQCETKFVPAVHVYSNGQLQMSQGLGKAVPWETFKPKLDECRDVTLQIYSGLHALGYTTFLERMSLASHDDIQPAIGRCATFVLVLSAC